MRSIDTDDDGGDVVVRDAAPPWPVRVSGMRGENFQRFVDELPQDFPETCIDTILAGHL
jgi:hypothetical protein